jgi:hypothetical protein
MLFFGSNRWTARAVFGQIAAQPAKPILISPFTAADMQQFGQNAYAEGIPVIESVPLLGSAVTLHYTPGMWHGPFAGDADDVLLHELVHAMRQEQGTFLKIPTSGGDAGYDDDEEFLAILLTNIALSEKSPGAPLRRDHGAGQPLPPDESDSRGFLEKGPQTDNLKWMQFLFPQESPLFFQVANSPAIFNPIREFIQHPERYAPGANVVNTVVDDGENAVDQGADWVRNHL